MNKAAVSAYFAGLGKVGGKRRWNKISKKERSEQMRKLAQLRHEKARA
ncbi:MAG TPA: hypothetical protein VFA99_17785 [Acidobacteriaceae bacterium]|nr:hypothetical protein [Acidobacteriaceae bacterium]